MISMFQAAGMQMVCELTVCNRFQAVLQQSRPQKHKIDHVVQAASACSGRGNKACIVLLKGQSQ